MAKSTVATAPDPGSAIADDETASRTYEFTGDEPAVYPTIGWAPETKGETVTLVGQLITANNLRQVAASRVQLATPPVDQPADQPAALPAEQKGAE